MTPFRPTTLLAFAISIAVAVSGCGGDDSGASGTRTTTTSMLSKAVFVKQANAACLDERAKLPQRLADFKRENSAGQRSILDMVHAVYLPTIEAQTWRIEELGAPRGDEARVDAILDELRTAVDAVAVIPNVPSIAAADRHFGLTDRLLRAYGLLSCTRRPRQPPGT
jgi:hypothetical protein